MAIDLARPLIPKRGPRKEFEAVQITTDRYVLLPAGNCQPEPYSSLLVRTLGDIEEEFRNVPERRTLDCVADIYEFPRADGVVGVLLSPGQEGGVRGVTLAGRQALKPLTIEYEVGEGL